MCAFYTKTGDDGFTGILGEGRVAKYDPRLEALGAIDEATSAIGLARASGLAEGCGTLMVKVQRDLYRMMAEIAASQEAVKAFRAIDETTVAWLEQEIERFTGQVKMPEEFIIPGDSQPCAAIDMARTVIRRAERRAAELFHFGLIQNGDILRYLNRLSSLFFVVEIYQSQVEGRSQMTLARVRNGT